MDSCKSRRNFLKTSLLGGSALAIGKLVSVQPLLATPVPSSPVCRVALSSGDDHTNIVFKSLEPLKNEIIQAIGNRTVLIKPNNVSIHEPLSATPMESLEGILEFLKSIGKVKNAMIAESAADGSTMEGFSNYNYPKLASKFGIQLVDLDQMPVQTIFAFDEKDMRPHPVRVSRLLLDRSYFIISAAKLKTHDRVIATLSLKNIVFGAPIKDLGFAWGPGRKAGTRTDKPILHGTGFRGINYNLFAMAGQLRPDLAVIDGYRGMEGNGPTAGTPVEHRVALASLDWLAADRVAVELMGIDFSHVGYLNYCATAGMGETNIEKMDILGEKIASHVKPYKMSQNYHDQLIWMKPASL